MAKINHNNNLETINDFIEKAKEEKVLHLYAEDSTLDDAHLRIFDTDSSHFATTGYLGLEQDSRLKQAAAEAVCRYGTQFPLSRTYVSHPLYTQLEKLLREIYHY